MGNKADTMMLAIPRDKGGNQSDAEKSTKLTAQLPKLTTEDCFNVLVSLKKVDHLHISVKVC